MDENENGSEYRSFEGIEENEVILDYKINNKLNSSLFPLISENILG